MSKPAELYLWKYSFQGEQSTPWDGHVLVIAGSQTTALKKAREEVKSLGYKQQNIEFQYKKKITSGMVVDVNPGAY